MTTDQSPLQSNVETVLADLVGIVNAHDEALAELEQQRPARPAESAGSREAARPDVGSPTFVVWVSWLADEFSLHDVLREGWQDVPAVVDELWALYHAYHDVFAGDEDATGMEAVYWHDALARVANRLREWRSSVDRRPPRRPDVHLPAFLEWVGWLADEFSFHDVLREGWQDVPAVVDELWALWRAYEDTFAGEHIPRGIDEVYWHDALARVANRLPEWRTAAVGEPSAEEFAAWVEWLRTTYLLERKITDRWADSEAVVAELRALHKAYRSAFAPNAGAFEQVYWHDALARVTPRIAEWFNEQRRPRN